MDGTLSGTRRRQHQALETSLLANHRRSSNLRLALPGNFEFKLKILAVLHLYRRRFLELLLLEVSVVESSVYPYISVVFSAPGPVEDLRVTPAGPGSARVTWRPPTNVYGSVQSYDVTYQLLSRYVHF